MLTDSVTFPLIFDNQLALVQHLTDTYNTGLDTLEAKGLKWKQGLIIKLSKS